MSLTTRSDYRLRTSLDGSNRSQYSHPHSAVKLPRPAIPEVAGGDRRRSPPALQTEPGKWDCTARLSPFCTARHGAIDAATLNTSVRVIWAWRYVRLCLAKYSSTLVGKYRQTHRQLRARVYCQLHQQLHHELNLALYRNLDPSLYRELFATSYQSRTS